MTDLELAQGIAAKFHAEQMYGVHPYAYHLDQVEASVAEAYPHDANLHIVARLHDVIEDTPCRIEFIGGLFGPEICAALTAITKGASEEGGDYLNRCKANPMAHIVKIHDCFCNLRQSMQDNDRKRIRRYTAKLGILLA